MKTIIDKLTQLKYEIILIKNELPENSLTGVNIRLDELSNLILKTENYKYVNPTIFNLLIDDCNVSIVDSYMDNYLVKLVNPLFRNNELRYEIFDQSSNDGIYLVKLKNQPKTNKMIYHGGCLDCDCQDVYGIERCLGCCYYTHNWESPNLHVSKSNNKNDENIIESQPPVKMTIFRKIFNYFTNKFG